MASTHKKVIVRKYDRSSLQGFAAGESFVQNGLLEMLNLSGKVMQLPLDEIKDVHFVKEFSSAEALGSKTFVSRPRVEGLWIRLTFRDNDQLEGLIPNDLLALGRDGIQLTPPSTRSNTQHIFVPRTSIASLEVLAITGGGKLRRAKSKDSRQEQMFPL
jgi:hypothetical protein